MVRGGAVGPMRNWKATPAKGSLGRGKSPHGMKNKLVGIGQHQGDGWCHLGGLSFRGGWGQKKPSIQERGESEEARPTPSCSFIPFPYEAVSQDTIE